jgi:hypothetical protein
MKGEKIFFKENIPAFSVQGKSRSISVLQKNLVTIIQNISYLLKSRSDDNEKMSCYRQFIRGFNFYKENYIHDIPFF